MSLFSRVFGDPNQREVDKLKPILTQIGALEPSIQSLSDEELAAKTVGFRARLAQGEELDAMLPEAFAVAREASRRVLAAPI